MQQQFNFTPFCSTKFELYNYQQSKVTDGCMHMD